MRSTSGESRGAAVTTAELVDVYCLAWTVPSQAERARLLEASCTEDVVYTDPGVDVRGRRALAEHIDKVQRKRLAHVVLRTSEIDEHHSMCRFSWCITDSAGHRRFEGVDLAFVDAGRISRVIGFFGPLLLNRPAAAGA